MTSRIGFMAGDSREQKQAVQAEPPVQPVPRKSVVQVQFPGWEKTLAYYNDRFDLHTGDAVYVDGKLERKLGRVTEVSYQFKIRLSDYKRVIARVDTTVHGQLWMAGSHFLTFDREALAKEKVRLWFLPPDVAEYVSGSDDSMFALDDLSGMDVQESVARRGLQYYQENRVCYLCVEETRGYAIVRGTEMYEVEFTYWDGEIRNLTCTCFCSFRCKHCVAAMLQLRETLEAVARHEKPETPYFAAIDQASLFRYAVAGKQDGSVTL